MAQDTVLATDSLDTGRVKVNGDISELFSKSSAVADVSTLKGLTGIADGEWRYLACYSSAGDGGHGWVRYNASQSSPDEGTKYDHNTLSGGWDRPVDAGVLYSDWWGPDKTGVTSARNALASAIAAAANRTLIITPGLYLIGTSELQVSTKCHIEISEGATLFKQAALFQHVLKVNSSAAGTRISGFGIIDGNKDNQASGQERFGLNIAASDCRIEDITVQNASGYGIFAQGDRIKIHRVTAKNCKWDQIFCETGAVDRTHLEVIGTHVEVANLSGSGGIAVIPFDVVSTWYNVKIHGNTVVLSTAGIGAFYPYDGITCFRSGHNVSIENNHVIGGNIGISIASQTDYTCVGNVLRNQAVTGIEQTNSTGGTVDGNTIIGASGTVCDAFQISNSHKTAMSGNHARDVRHGYFINVGSEVAVSGGQLTNLTGKAILIKGNSLNHSYAAISIDGCQYMCEFDTGVGQATFTGMMVRNTTNGYLSLFSTSTTYDDISVVGGRWSGSGSLVNQSISGTAALGNNISVRGISGQLDIDDVKNNIKSGIVTGTPEAAVTAGIGSMVRRRDGGAGTTLYVKQSGTGNTGWVGK